MTTFERIEKLLNSNLDMDDEYGYRDLGSFIIDYNETINTLNEDRYESLKSNSSQHYNSKLYRIIKPHFNLKKYKLLKLEIKSFCNERDYNTEYFFNDNKLPLTIDHESGFHHDLNITIRHEHLEKEEGIILYEFQESFFEFIKLRFIDNLAKLDNYKFKKVTYKKEKKEAVKSLKLFESYFIKGINKKELNLLKKTFSKNNSPKEYAIMTSLLYEYGLIHIASKKRTEFYKAWYKHINKPSHSDQSKNNFFDNSKSELVFKYPNDKTYVYFKELFIEKFKSLINR